MARSTLRRPRAAAGALAAAGVLLAVARPGAGPVSPEAAAGVPIDAATARAGLTFEPGVAPGDRAWVLAALAAARPEARGLVERVDGLVRLRTTGGLPDQVVGQTAFDGRRFVVTLDVAELDGRRVQDRDVVVLHELGHVIDAALVPAGLARELDAGIPRSGACVTPDDPTGPCAAREERFADTFAKWALRGAVSEVGAGYGIPMPPSLEDWGAPLARLVP
jgi:hypothetical protein